jgi:hypothetical protein
MRTYSRALIISSMVLASPKMVILTIIHKGPLK